MTKETGTSAEAKDEIPQGLIDAIQSGECVAFIGSGFTAPVMGMWRDLLTNLAKEVLCDLRATPSPTASPKEAERAERVEKAIESVQQLLTDLEQVSSSSDFEALAQILEDASGLLSGQDVKTPPDSIAVRHANKVLRDKIRTLRNHALKEESRNREHVNTRLQLLRQIPFRAILTTNFDDLIRADEAKKNLVDLETLAVGLFKPAQSRMEALKEFPPQSSPEKSRSLAMIRPVGHLHGRVLLRDHGSEKIDDAQITLSTRGYRERTSSAYRALLRTLFTTKPVLFLGYSFTDFYIRELRSELIGDYGRRYKKNTGTVDYVISHDVSDNFKRHQEKHEAMHVISYKTKGDGERDIGHGAFDELLAEIEERTNPVKAAMSVLGGGDASDANTSKPGKTDERGGTKKRILWFRKKEDDYLEGLQLSDLGAQIEYADDIDALIKNFERNNPDLIITPFMGKTVDGAKRWKFNTLVDRLRERKRWAPIIVYTRPGRYLKENRRTVRKAGGIDAVVTSNELFSLILDILGDKTFTTSRDRGA